MKIDLSVPRRQYQGLKVKFNKCPECGKELIKQSCPILLHIISDFDEASFFTNCNGSRFCTKCPVVVFDEALVYQAAIEAMKNAKKLQYMILGIVDLEAVPINKRHLEFDDDDNPTPIVYFLPDLKKPKITVNLPSQNGPCICGSGKQYKRCCGK